MTVSSTISRKLYAGNDSTTAFPTTFKFLLNGDLQVILRSVLNVETTLTETTHYTLTGAGVDAGGTVTMITPPATGEVLILQRATAKTQGADYVENDPFPANTHETALDRLTLITQETGDTSDRSITAPAGDTDPQLELPAAADRANSVVVFDANGDVSTAPPSTVGGLGIEDNATEVAITISTDEEVGIGRAPTAELDVYRATGAVTSSVESGDSSVVGQTLKNSLGEWRVRVNASGDLELADTTGATIPATLDRYNNIIIGSMNRATGAQGVLHLTNAAVFPAASTVDGCALFADAGALKFRGTSGSSVEVVSAAGVVNPDGIQSGSWTPTLQDPSLSDAEGQTYTVQYGRYTKLGNRVFITGRMSVSSLGTLTTNSAAHVGGLPFTSENVNDPGSVSMGGASNLNIAAGQTISAEVHADATYLDLQLWDAATGSTTMLISEYSGSGLITFHGQYTTP